VSSDPYDPKGVTAKTVFAALKEEIDAALRPTALICIGQGPETTRTSRKP
jgi:hypothetical protein